ncbi:MAG: ATP-binding cassette domain-containing protein [Thermoleophilia bacterium]
MGTLARFDGATKRYGSRTVVDDLTFDVAEGSVTGLLGPNGAGKSTAIRLLLGIAGLTGGSCELLGAEPGGRGFRAAVRGTGSLIEAPSLYANATARGNLEIWAVSRGMRRTDPRIGRVLEQVGLAGRGDDRAKNFSLGMRQRLGIAMAIVHEPQLVILDEPTNGLDPAGTVEIRELIRSLPSRGATVLVSSHVLGEVQKTVDHVVIIAAGRLRTSRPMSDFLAEMSGDEFTVVLAPDAWERGRAALAAAGLQVEEAGQGTLHVTGEPRGSAIAKALADAGVYPDELHHRESSLEEAFLALTGTEPAGAEEVPA